MLFRTPHAGKLLQIIRQFQTGSSWYSEKAQVGTILVDPRIFKTNLDLISRRGCIDA